MPNKFGIIIALVFLFILFSIFSTLIINLLISTSTKLGTKPSWYIGATVVEKVNVGVIISLFFLSFKDARAKRLAEDPEFTLIHIFYQKVLQPLVRIF